MTAYLSNEEKITGYLDQLISESDPDHPAWNQEAIRQGKKAQWNYIDGCMLTAVMAMYEQTGQKKYLDFADAYVGWFVQDDGTILTYDAQERNLDNISMGRTLFPLYDLTGKQKYRQAMETIRRQLDLQPRTKAGSFWHKQIYPYQVWLDGLYMAEPFYMAYETRYKRMEGCRDVFLQYMNVKKCMRDQVTGLYYHGYDESRKMYWADPVTGCSPNFWLRSIGWFSASLADTVDAMSETLYYEMRYLMAMLKDLVDALLPWQDESGMFWQVVNFPGEEGNYLETSGTALIAYAILKGVRLRMLPQRYAAYGEKALQGIMDRYLTLEESAQGKVSLDLGGICLVAGLGGKDHRDGSRPYYYSEPVVQNDAKGIGPFILAYTEHLRRNTK